MKTVFKKSAQYAFAIIGGFSTLASLCNYTLRDISSEMSLLNAVFVVVGLYATLWGGLILWYRSQRHKPYGTKINGKRVLITVGDIFEETGWKIIPFNERFDTQVDDIIIAHNSLNGMMIDYHADINQLRRAIKRAKTDLSPFKADENGIFPLGRIIPYETFLILAFSHFNSENKAIISINEYEPILLRMWSEIRRVYAGREVVLPLLGTGITNIDGLSEKDYTELLRCMLCTLKRSKFEPLSGLKIVLTADGIKQIDMNAIKELF